MAEAITGHVPNFVENGTSASEGQLTVRFKGANAIGEADKGDFRAAWDTLEILDETL